MTNSAIKTGGTLPVEFSDHLYLNTEQAKIYGSALQEAHVNADPFPHTIIDNFLPEPLLKKILENFPAQAVEDEVVFNGGYIGHHKRQIPPEKCNGFNRELFAFFNSAPILKFLENVTGIKKLLPDPYFVGAGYHEISRGGLLGIHADFRLNKQLSLHRRINMLIYLNDGWQPEWGGKLELWDKQMKNKVVETLPVLNRCVIFNTDSDSYHGHPVPLNCPEHVKRKSIALYYYTASDSILDEMPGHGTMYVSRPDDGLSKKLESVFLRLENYMDDLLPPILSRNINKLKYKIINVKKRIKGSRP